jgi:hypothetical protein
VAVQWLNQALYFYQVSSWFKVKCFEVANFWQPQNDIRRDALQTIQGHSAYFEDKDIFYNDPIAIDGYDVRRLTNDGILAQSFLGAFIIVTIGQIDESHSAVFWHALGIEPSKLMYIVQSP